MFLTILLSYFFFLIILSSFLVVFTKNSIFSAIFLILGFVFASITLLLLECELMSFIFLVVYIGAIAILFLFVVMLIDIKAPNLVNRSTQYFPFGLFISVVFLSEISFLLLESFQLNHYTSTFLFNELFNWYSKLEFFFEIGVIGQLIYSNYTLSFLLAGLLLFLVILGVIVLTLKPQVFKSQIHLKQLTRTFNRAVFFKSLNDNN